MNTKRLTALAAMLATVPPEKFDLRSWRADAPGGEEYWQDELTDAKLLDPACGTCGCAVGWACVNPAFQAQGLSWNGTPIYACPDDEGRLAGWSAVTAFFDISRDAADHLFNDGDYEQERVTAAEVADRITALIAANTPAVTA